MRRTANINLIADEYENDFVDIKRLLSINKKIEMLIGFNNNSGEYNDYPIIWFPQGIYVIINLNISHGSGGVNIALTLHDKMALLNGECGGTLPAAVIFSEIEDVNENGVKVISQPTIYQIIQEIVNHFGGEQLGKIIISDIDNQIKKVMKWTGSVPLYLYSELQEDGTMYHSFSTDYSQLSAKQTQNGTITQFSYGEDVGYIYTDFVYPTELIGKAGDTITTILDQIKNILGNYEYFYDIDGNFRFQQIKNYLNTSYSTFLINEMNEDNYLVDYSGGKSVYTFEDANIIQSYSNSPQYQKIKNDFVVWGKRKSIEGLEIPIRYHLAIDTQPEIGNQYNVFFYKDPDDGIVKAKKPYQFAGRNLFPQTGQPGGYYYATNTGIIYEWSVDTKTYKQTSYQIKSITATDYRTELYLSGVISEPFGLDSNYYFTELKNEWPKVYDIQNGQFFKDAVSHPNDIDFFLDFIDTSSNLSEFNVQNIGRRTTTIVDDSINCVFMPNNPDIVIIEAGSENANTLQTQCQNKQQDYAQVRSEVYSMLANGGMLKSAYDEIKKELYQYTNYNEQISLTMIPIYYLEPNIRITVQDEKSGIYGDYMIKSISLPLDTNSTMNLSCTRVLERNTSNEIRKLTSITAVFNANNHIIYTTDNLNTLKQYLTVTAHYDDNSTAIVTLYQLNGKLTKGKNTITISYQNKTTTFTIANVIDFYDIWNWSFSTNGFTKLTANVDIVSNALTGAYISLIETRPNAARYRRTISILNGILSYTDYVSHTLTEYYPIPVPKTANKITVSITPNNQYSFINLLKYNYESNKYTKADDYNNIQGWVQGDNIKTFTASDNLFVNVNFKYDSAGNSYPIEPSNIIIKFEKV